MKTQNYYFFQNQQNKAGKKSLLPAVCLTVIAAIATNRRLNYLH
jgi:hypothetical protein